MPQTNSNRKLTLSVVVVAYNEEKYIGQCLDGIMQNIDGYVDEVIVVDNNSTDKTNEIVQGFPTVRLVLEQTKGVTHARQKGYKESRGDIIVFLDGDTRPNSSYFKQVYERFASDETIGFLSGPYIYFDATFMQHMFSKLYRWFSYFFMYKCVGYLGVGGNMILTKKVLDKMKGFDTTIVFYGDDTNTARRARQFAKGVFDLSLVMPTSFRRFTGQGLLKTLHLYFMNAFYEIFFHKPYSKSQKIFR